MGFVFRRRLAIPLWAVASCGLALTWLPGPFPSLAVVMAVAVSAWLTIAIVRRMSTRSVVAVGVHARTLETAAQRPAEESSDALDLVRMDDDGGWQLPLRRSLAGPRRASRTEARR